MRRSRFGALPRPAQRAAAGPACKARTTCRLAPVPDGTGLLLVTTSGGTGICLMRIAVKRAARNGEPGYFDVKAFGDQAAACADYLSAGREVGIEGRLRFEEFETKGGDYASRVYIVADAVEFLTNRRRRDDSRAEDGQERDAQAEAAGAASGSEDEIAF